MEMDGWRMTETRTVDASEAEEANTGIHFALGFLFSFNFNNREGNNNPTTTDWKKVKSRCHRQRCQTSVNRWPAHNP